MGIHVLGLHVLIVTDRLLLELSNRWLRKYNCRDAGLEGISQFFQDGTDLSLLLQKEGNFGAVETQLV